MLKSIIIILAIMFVIICLIIFTADGQKFTAEQWREDLKYLTVQVELRHPNPWYYGATSEEYLTAADELSQELEKLPDGRIVLELFRLHAMIEDGHSAPVWESIPKRILSPNLISVAFYSGANGIFIHRAHKDYLDYIGWYLTHINNRPIEDVLKLLEEYVSGDNSFRRRILSIDLLRHGAVLYNLHIIDSPDSIPCTIQNSEGVIKKCIYPAEKQNYAHWTLLREFSQDPIPLWLTNNSKRYWHTYLPEHKLVYMQFNSIQNDPDNPFEEYCDTLFELIEKESVEKFIIDLRHNGGGNNAVYWPLIHHIALCKKINKAGRFFVIFGRHSESAAVSFAVRLQNLTNVIFVGEPTGGRPNGHGVVSTIVLPNSGIKLNCSSLFVRPTLNPDRRPWLTPHLTAELTLEDYKNNYDQALESIKNYKHPISFREFINSKGEFLTAEKLFEYYYSFRNIRQNKWVAIESDLDEIGMKFLNAGHIEEAVKVFEFVVEQYPTSWKAYHSMAKALEIKGNRDQAHIYFAKSFSLNKMNFDALQRLE